MIPNGNIQSNVERFLGFEELYDKHRPEAPPLVVDIIVNYLKNRPSLVVDLGCGTGLSSFLWEKHADHIIGVEPNPDMLGKARHKLEQLHGIGNMSFIQGYSNQLNLETATADVITCSQSFHWMEPVSTLQEVSRVLRDGGIFAAYDCDWPPALSWTIENQYILLMNKADEIVNRLASPESLVHKWSKDLHVANMIRSRSFRFTKELVFHHMEPCDAQRYVGLALSQGGLQTVFKLGSSELDPDLAAFRDSVENHFGGKSRQIMFSYRMRLGVK